MNTRMSVTVQSAGLLRKASSLFAAISIVLLPFSPIMAVPVLAAPTVVVSEVHIDSINGLPPTGHCVAGDLIIIGHGTTGSQGGPYKLDIGWGDGSASTTITNASANPPLTSGTLNGAEKDFTFTVTHSPIGPSTGLTLFLHHSTGTGNDDHTIVINQCVADPTQGVLTVNKLVVGGTATSSDFTLTVKQGASNVAGSPFAGSANGSDFQLNPATYVVSETADPSYTSATVCRNITDNTPIVGASVSLLAGKNYACTITNTFVPPTTGTLHVVKLVTNNSGGNAVSSDFNLHVKNGANTDVAGSPAVGSSTGVDYTLSGGAYTVSEDVSAGYTGTFSGDCAPNGTVTVVNGQTKNCILTNNDNPGSITVTKIVNNNYRGTSVVSDFNLSVGLEAVISGIAEFFNAGIYSVTESGPTSGYNAVFSGDCDSNGSITLGLGGSKTCTITNSDKQPGTLHVIKHVINDGPEGFAGTATADLFTLTITGGNPNPSSVTGNESGVAVTVDGDGAYSVSETAGPSGYGVSYSTGCAGTMAQGGDVTCTVTNDDVPATQGSLTVIKSVVNNNGGDAVASDWTLQVTAADEGPTAIVTSGVATLFNPGTYTVEETGGPSGYAKTSTMCSTDGAEAVATDSVTVAEGHSYVCTITNDDIAPSLTIVKNTHGTDGSFTFAISGNETATSTAITTASGVGTSTVTLDAGSYSVVEQVPTGWKFNSVSCVYDNESTGQSVQNGEQISLDPGDDVTCTFDNTRLVGSLVVKKVVVNTNAGTATSSDFLIHVKQSLVDIAGSPATGTPTGTTYENLFTGIYSVSENAGPAGYSATFSGDCDADGNVTVSDDETATCIVTNTDISLPQCSDGIDNDGDGLIDNKDPGCYPNQNPNDTGSYNPNDNDETHVPESSGGGGNGGGGGGGGGGNGPIASSGGGSGSGAGQVLGAAIEAVQDCTKYLTAYIRSGRANDTAQVIRLQNFLNSLEGFNLDVNGTYDAPSLAAVNAFQVKYMGDVLTPWGATGPTGYVYYTTQKKVNEIYCKFTKEFPLTDDQKAEIARIKALGGSFTPAASATPASPIVAPAQPATPASPAAPADDTQEVGSASSVDSSASAVNAEQKTGFFGKVIKWIFGN